jgi:hypothetical protein
MFSSALLTPDGTADPLTGVFAKLPPIPSALAQDLRNDVVEALGRRDREALFELLDEAPLIRPDVAAQAVWLPLVLGLGAWDAAARPLDGDDQLGRILRTQLRETLQRMPELPLSRWLIPATTSDINAAHLAVVMLAEGGVGARVWPWPMPAPGPSLVIADGRIPDLDVEAETSSLSALAQ